MGGVVNGAMAVSANGSVAKPADATQALAAGASNVSFQVDRDQIPGIITDLQHALGMLDEAKQQAVQHQHLVQPGTDPYSSLAIRTMGPALVNSYLAANKRDQDNLSAMIDNLDSAMRQYDAQDDAASQALQYGKA